MFLGDDVADLGHSHVWDHGESVCRGVLTRGGVLKEYLQLCLEIVHAGEVLRGEREKTRATKNVAFLLQFMVLYRGSTVHAVK